MHEKACKPGGYVDDFRDWDDDTVIPEACVLDMIRGKAVSSVAKVMILLQKLVMEGVTLDIEGEVIHLTSARNKLKFVGEDLDPMHGRNILNNLILSVGKRSVFIELQVHHQAIYEYKEESHEHDVYEHFRSGLKKYQEGLE